MQTRRGSLIEVLMNIGTGFIVSYTLTLYLLPLYGFFINKSQSLTITMIFTVTSIIRSYLYRRLFNYFEVKKFMSNSIRKR